MNSRPLHFALRELSSLLAMRRLWSAFAVVVLVFALTGPFGTYQSLSLPMRAAYWLGTQAVCWLIALVCIAICSAMWGQGVRGNVRAMSIGAIVAGPFIAAFIEANLWVLFGEALSWTGFAVQVLYTLPLSLIFCALAYLLISGQSPSDPAQDPLDQRNRLLDRLPAQKRGNLLFLTMQDHYVEVVTDKGREMVLMRFADAIAEIPEGLGLQIHRSHWVARKAVQATRRDNGKLILTMAEGTELPVSRSFAKTVKAAGLV